MKRLVGSVCLAVACMAATTCKADDRPELAIEASYWMTACGPEFEASRGLTESVYGFSLGFMNRLSKTGNREALLAFVEASVNMAAEGVRDSEAQKFNREQCGRLVADFAVQWNTDDDPQRSERDRNRRQ